MGVDTTLYISNEWRIEDIKDVIQKRFSVPVEIMFHDWAPDYIILRTQLDAGEYDVGNKIQLSVHTKSYVGGLPAIAMTLRSNTINCEFLKTLAKTFGGLFQESDTTEDFEAFQKPGEGNIDFVIRKAIMDDPSLGDDDKRMASYIAEEKWRMSSDVWHKPNKAKE